MSDRPAGDSVIVRKDELRARLRAQRRSAPPDPGRGARIADALLSMPEAAARVAPGAVVACYVSLPWEPPTPELRGRLRQAGCRVFLPVAGADRRLTWVADPGESAEAWGVSGRAGTREGTTTELSSAELLALGLGLVCVPALAATVCGGRLGQGGGYYDTFLAALPRAADGGPLRVALVGPGEVVDSLPVAAHDEPVDGVAVG